MIVSREAAHAVILFALTAVHASGFAQNFSLSGTLVDADSGQAIGDDGSQVCVSNLNWEQIGCVSTANGEFSFTGLPADDYLLQGFANGYAEGVYPDDISDNCGNADLGEPISLSADVTGLEFPLFRGMFVEGHVLNTDGAPTRLARVTITALDHERYCVPWRLSVMEGGKFGTPRGWNALFPGQYLLSAVPLGPGAAAHQVIEGGADELIKDIELQLRGDAEPRVTTAAPDMSRIDISAPNAEHFVTISGTDGAVLPMAQVYLINIDVGTVEIAESDDKGAFSADLYAPEGSLLTIRQDDTMLASSFIARRKQGRPDINQAEKTLAGALVFPDTSDNPLSFIQSGTAKDDDVRPMPAWQVEGLINANQLDPGETLEVTGQVRVLTDDPGANPTLEFASIWLERITEENGREVMRDARFTSTLMTPTGLPIESFKLGGGTQVSGFFSVQFEQGQDGIWAGDLNVDLHLPEWLEPGYYQARLQVDWPSSQVRDEPPSEYYLIFTHARPTPLPVIRVGQPAPPKLHLHLLTNQFHNGSRGIRALEDFDEFGLTPVIGTASDTLVLPMDDPLTGARVSYNLEPFIPQLTRSVRSPPYRRAPAFKFPSGELRITVESPSGKTRRLGPAAFQQITTSSPAKADGTLIGVGGQHMNNVAQLRTLDPAFDVRFNEYGKHIVRMDMSVEDLYGNTWTGVGTYELWVARPLSVDTTVIPGMSFQRGDTLNTGVVVSPAGPATVEWRYMMAPDSVAEDRYTRRVAGVANRFGHFTGQPLVLDDAGEYRADIVAHYWDEDGVLWMGSRTWGGVVARPNPPIIAHGRRGVDDSPDTGPQWFTREGLGVPEGNSHVPNPHANGDIQWVHNGDSAVPFSRVQAIDNAFESLMRSRLQWFLPPEELDAVAAAGAYPLEISTSTGIDAEFDRDAIDYWSYSYMTSSRPLVRVREVIADSHPKSYWRFDEQYLRQTGVGLDGDRTNEVKFQYIGAVIRGDALEQPEYAIHGSLFVLVPDPWEENGFTRTMPPFQGNGGGPTGGPIITHKGEDIDLLINLRAARPGSIFEVGEAFSLAGAFGPTLPAKLQYLVTRPDGSRLRFNTGGKRQGNPVGWYYVPDDDFELDQPGVWTVDLKATFDGRTSAGQVSEPFPTGDVLGSDDGRFTFYVVDPDKDLLGVDLPRHSLFEPGYSEFDAYENRYQKDFMARLPDGYAVTSAHVTTMMPGTILESRELDESLVYALDVTELGLEVPNLDSEESLGDLLTVSFYVEAEDGEGNIHHLGRVVNLHGPEIFALDVPVPDDAPFAINAGLSDAWYNKATDGQGFFIIAWPDIERMFAAWFTYETEIPAENTAILGDSGQRWITAFGPYSEDGAVLDINVTSGGIFDDPAEVEGTPGGTLTVDFESCTAGTIAYDITATGDTGEIPVQRLAPDNVALCEQLADGASLN